MGEVTTIERNRDTQMEELNSIEAALPSALSRYGAGVCMWLNFATAGVTSGTCIPNKVPIQHSCLKAPAMLHNACT